MPKMTSSLVVRYSAEADSLAEFTSMLLKFREWLLEQPSAKESVAVEIQKLGTVIAIIDKQDAEGLVALYGDAEAQFMATDEAKADHFDKKRERWNSLATMIKNQQRDIDDEEGK
jgi:hypothetical protein